MILKIKFIAANRMMQPTKDLFQLVKSLSQSEKIYFKKYTSLHVLGGVNNYILLFNVIEQQKQYDETLIKEHFKKHAFIMRIPVEKTSYNGSAFRDRKENKTKTFCRNL